jgi:ABC-type dipeptide/oligopeptide/nickel transport system ATPase subunit
MNQSIVIVERLSKSFVAHRQLFSTQRIAAVKNVSLPILRGRILALVGESGSGKSTMARLLMKIETPSAGNIRIDQNGRHVDIATIAARDYYRCVQMVFQDPYSSVNPRKRLWQVVTSAPANLNHLDRRELRTIAAQRLDEVGLGQQYMDAFPDTLSGGQRQRLCIARALAARPEILVLDEPLSALDLSIQAQILNLLIDLQQRLDLTYVFISHDLAVVRHIADDIAVMQGGQLVEHGTAAQVLTSPNHAYTRSLLNSARRTQSARTPRSTEAAGSLLGCFPTPFGDLDACDPDGSC